MATEVKKTGAAAGSAVANDPNKKFLVAGVLLLALGGTWFVYDAFIRAPTKEEQKKIDDERKAEEQEKKMEEKKAREKKGLH